MAYLEWGDVQNPRVLVCVHGLTRSSRDFDQLARALAAHYRVVCPDVAGRGESQWLPEARLYTAPQYVADMVTLIARLDVESVHWLGTSMGGLIGMALAAQKETPIARLVLNEAGPLVGHRALERIGMYVGKTLAFANFEEAERYVRTVAAPFGVHSDSQWRFLTETWVRRNDDGTYRAHYDPAIGDAFRASMPEGDLDLWPLYDAIRCPTLVLRGEHSDLLSRETVEQMAQRGPRAKVVEVTGVGHAPTLMHEDQITIVRNFLFEGDT